jgi:2-pyrone-4,6-dicarboxylate lactonase
VESFTVDADWLVFDPSPSAPTFRVPDGAVDAHCHVIGPGWRFPFSPERKYTPADATKEDLFRLRDFLGFDRNVIVQATCHGSNNAAMVDALIDADGRARGIATLEPSVSRAELDDLDAAGVRGVRFNYVRRLVDPEPDRYYYQIVDKIAPLGWHVDVYFEAADLAERWDFFTSLETVVVVDHMGRPDVTRRVDGPEFGLFLRLLREHDNVWAKVSCPERLSVTGPPDFRDTAPFARRVVEEFPDRVLWGTDWPHPNMKDYMPDDGQLVDYITRVATNETLQRRLLVDNPARLYWKEG